MSAPMCGLPSTVTIPGPLHLERAIEKLRWAVGGEFSATLSPQECEALLAAPYAALVAVGATGKAGT